MSSRETHPGSGSHVPLSSVEVWEEPTVNSGRQPKPGRRAEIERALPADPVGLAPLATDRTAWARAAAELPAAEILAAAREEAEHAPPELSDALYQTFHTTGERQTYQLRNTERLYRLNLFAWAEALEHEGHFMAALERELGAMLVETTWVLPAHDRDLRNFSGRVVEVDLAAARRGWSIAVVVAWHADQLSPALQAAIKRELRRRIIGPYLALVRGERTDPGMWWLRADMNWNSVCNAGVGTALAVVESRAERAEILAAAEANFSAYMSGFTPDGYCSEGVAYWNYGFGHAVMLAEVAAAATSGLVRLLQGAHAASVAAYPWALEIVPGVYPAFSDMGVRAQASAWTGRLAQRQLAVEPQGVQPEVVTVAEVRSEMLYQLVLRVLLSQQTAHLPAVTLPRTGALRDTFDDGQVFVSRASAGFGVALKGGHNAELHNHNDVGSFVVAAGGRAVLVDPGNEVYTARTFNSGRYESNVINSYGHPVPVVAGSLQRLGRAAAARVVATEWADHEDRVVLDLTAAYDVPALRTLRRTFVLRRGATPELEVTDEVEFKTPGMFGTALLTFDAWTQTAVGALTVGLEDGGVSVAITAEGGSWKLRAECIEETLPGGQQPTRLGIEFDQPVTRAIIRLRITPSRGGEA